MTVDRTLIGMTTEPSRIRVDAWRVKLFCQAVGELNPAHWDQDAARAAGLPACVVPPTFLKAIEAEHCSSATLLNRLQVPVRKVLHAEQSFDILQPVQVGDEVEMSRTVKDIYDKRDGAMTFIVVETSYRVRGQAVASSVQTILVRNEQGGSR